MGAPPCIWTFLSSQGENEFNILPTIGGHPSPFSMAGG
jgi:hypothetical protein